MKTSFLLQLLPLVFFFYSASITGSVIYVDKDASGNNNGNSWTHAYTSLQSAIAAAVDGDEVWVAEGIYKTTSTTDRNVFFSINSDISIYGGFNGTEIQRSDRNWHINETILSGAIGSDTTETDNSKRILRIISESAVLIDGFHIRRAYGNISTNEVSRAIEVNQNCSLELKHCSIYEHSGPSYAVIFNSGYTSLSNCLIRDNHVNGGTHLNCGNTNAVFDFYHCTIADNTFGESFAGVFGSAILNGTTGIFNLYNSIVWKHDNELAPSTLHINAYNCLLETTLNFDVLENVITENPLFTNTADDDFTIRPDSPARNTAESAYPITNNDLAHNTRIFDIDSDMGCYESQKYPVLHVDIQSAGGSGSNWADAFFDIHNAIDYAVAGQQIWVAAGTYMTSLANDPLISFELPDDVKLYGGFIGTETSLDQRDWRTNITVLSGNLGNTSTDTDNANHVCKASSPGSAIYLDGFSILGGNARDVGLSAFDTWGGGLLVEPGVEACVIRNCSFYNNIANFTGGGLHASAPMEIRNCTFYNNQSYFGAALSYESDAIISNSYFIYNTGTESVLSAISGFGLALASCTFENNEVTYPGARLLDCYDAFITNTIIWNNDLNATEEIINFNGAPALVSYCVLQGIELDPSVEGASVFYTDPLLEIEDSFYRRPGLLSPAFNSGNPNIIYPAEDILGHPRILLQTPDIGAVESYGTVPGVVYVDQSATGLNNGSSWENAYDDLDAAVSNAIDDIEIWVAGGGYKPTTGTSRSKRFEIEDNISLYGGFTGTETQRTQRNWNSNATILSGAIGTNQVTDNSRDIINVYVDNMATIDGFILEDAYEDPDSTLDANAISIDGGTFYVVNCIIRNNTSNSSAAVQTGDATLYMENCLISGNTIKQGSILGNGMSNSQQFITGCTFSGNHMIQSYATILGGHALSFFELNNCIIWGNDNPFSNSVSFTFGNNIIDDFVVNSYDSVTGTVFSFDPQFTDPANGDFSLRSTSPAINLGKNDDVNTSMALNGSLRILHDDVDLGCYEVIECTPENDLESEPFLIDAGEVFVGTNRCATASGEFPVSCSLLNGGNVWFYFYGPESGRAQIEVNHIHSLTPNFNPRVAVYLYSYPTNEFVACANETGSGEDETLVINDLVYDSDYLIRIDGIPGQEGIFEILVTELPAICEGDFDNNGSVNIADLLIFTSTYGCIGNCGITDLDNNGAVNIADLLVFTSKYGIMCY